MVSSEGQIELTDWIIERAISESDHGRKEVYLGCLPYSECVAKFCYEFV
jgi:hypothetical protein